MTDPVSPDLFFAHGHSVAVAHTHGPASRRGQAQTAHARCLPLFVLCDFKAASTPCYARVRDLATLLPQLKRPSACTLIRSQSCPAACAPSSKKRLCTADVSWRKCSGLVARFRIENRLRCTCCCRTECLPLFCAVGSVVQPA